MLKNINTDDKKYIYVANYPPYEKELYKMEMKSLFKNDIEEKYFFSDIWINSSRSPFIKEALKVIYEGDSVEEICDKIKEDKLSYEAFKVIYVKAEEKNTTYEERLNSLRAVGFVITGEPDIHNPRVRIGISKIGEKWYLGEYEKNDFEWHIHDKKPYSYSNSLGLKLARALVNIAGGNDFNIKMVDPCCGVGTVVIEGVSMGFNIKGFDINKHICSNARRNLEFFGYNDVVKGMDIKDIEEKFDVAIIDLPYGLFTPIRPNEQMNIINSARKIADKLILVTFEDMDEFVYNAGFKIIDRCKVSKGKFIRYISICI